MVAYPPPTIPVGDDRKGLSKEERAACSAIVSIPMKGNIDSLNVSIATRVILYELLNQAQPPFITREA
jgi:tRNA G18 (ribose-2'-O)-methylase SpoU